MTTIHEGTQIEWERGNFLGSTDRLMEFEAIGYDKEDRKYHGIMQSMCGEDFDVLDVYEMVPLPIDDNVHGSWGGYDY